MVTLNSNELAVFKALAENIQDETGGDFGFSDSIKLPEGIGRKQLSGYISQLVQKGLFVVDEEFGQVQVGNEFFSAAREHALFAGMEFQHYREGYKTV